MLGELCVLVVHRKTIVVGEEHNTALFVEAARENISGPNFAPVGPGVSVNKIASLDIEPVNGNNTICRTKNERVSDAKRSDTKDSRALADKKLFEEKCQT
jgi:hypothetical protein